jgi:PKD repeat protein
VRPTSLESAAENIAAHIVPLDGNGNVNTTGGKIVLLSIGMSNASDEWNGGPTAFEPVANADPAKNPKLAIVNGAQSGVDAKGWANPNSSAWTTVIGRLQSAGLTAKQVQFVWLKEAEAFPSQYGGFLPAAQKLQSDLEAIARNLKTKFPNIKIAYLSSRTHAFTTTGLNPEPYAYESGFAVKWAIQDQINGKGNLNWDSTKGAVVAPLLSWGSYLWANGTNPRSDGFTWTTNDVSGDLTHPSSSGITKIGQMLLAFFKTDPTSTPWFLRAASSSLLATVTLSADHVSGGAGLVVHFSASAIAVRGNTISQYAWTFDDGDFAFGATPTKTFDVPGTYIVHLAVSDSAGNVTLKTITITIGGGGGGSPLPFRVADAAAPTTAAGLVTVPASKSSSNESIWMSPPADWLSEDSVSTLVMPSAPTSAPSATALSGASSSGETTQALDDVFSMLI